MSDKMPEVIFVGRVSGHGIWGEWVDGVTHKDNAKYTRADIHEKAVKERDALKLTNSAASQYMKDMGERIRYLEKRLEITDSGNIDGIEARDETIKGQDKTIDALKAENERLLALVKKVLSGRNCNIPVVDTMPPLYTYSIDGDLLHDLKQALQGGE